VGDYVVYICGDNGCMVREFGVNLGWFCCCKGRCFLLEVIEYYVWEGGGGGALS